MMFTLASQRRVRPWGGGGLLALCLLLAGLVLALPAWAQQALPRIDSLLTDEAGVLSMAERTELGQRLTDIERRLGSQVLVLTVSTTAPESIEQYSMRVVEITPAGRKGIDDGVLILLAMNDRRMRIEVGYGLEGALPDAVVARIIREQMTPHMRNGNVAGALNAAVEAVSRRIAGEALPAPPPAAAGASSGTPRSAAQGVRGGTADYDSIVIGALFLSFILGGILVGMFGRLLGAVATGGLIGAGAWMLTASLFAALLAAMAGGFFTLLIGGRRLLTNRNRNRNNRRWPPGGGGWPGGGSPGGSSSGSGRRSGSRSSGSGRSGGGFSWPSGGGGWSSGGGGGGWSGGGGGGGWSGGGGGGFGGGGASGSW